MTELITAAEAIDLAFDDKNFDSYFIRSTLIQEVQEGYLPRVLGRDYFNELTTQKAANTLSAANTTLLDNYLKRAIAYLIKAQVIPRVAYRLTNTGIVVSKAEQTHPRLTQEVEKAVNDARASGEAWLKAATDFMEDPANMNSYPTFNSAGDDEPIIIGGLIIDRRQN